MYTWRVRSLFGWENTKHTVMYGLYTVLLQKGSTEEMPGNVHFCIQKAATHSHLIQLTLF